MPVHAPGALETVFALEEKAAGRLTIAQNDWITWPDSTALGYKLDYTIHFPGDHTDSTAQGCLSMDSALEVVENCILFMFKHTSTILPLIQ